MVLQQIQAMRNTSKTAIIYNGNKFSYDDFYEQVTSVVHKLNKLKIKNYENLAVIIINNLHLNWVTLIALRFLGFNTITLNSVEQIHQLGLKRIAYIFVVESEIKHILIDKIDKNYANKIIKIKIDCYFPDKELNSCLNLEHDLTNNSGHILYTSGTTGQYKKIYVSSNAELDFKTIISELYKLSDDTIFNNLYFPPYTAAGYRMPLSVWHSGGCVVFRQSNSPFKDFYDYKVTFTFMIPSMIQDFLKFVKKNKFAYSPNLTVLTGGGFLSESLASLVIQEITPNLIIVYGSTETISALISNYKSMDDLIWLEPVNSNEFYIFNNDGIECAFDEEGELSIKLKPIDVDHYLDDKEISKKIFYNGYFHPGDLAIKRRDGKIRITGRVADVLNIRGWKVSVGPIESQIQNFLKVNNVCVFSTLTDNGSSLAVVAVESDSALSEKQIEFLKKGISAFDEVIIKVLAEFPRTTTAMRKIDRRALRKIVLSF